MNKRKEIIMLKPLYRPDLIQLIDAVELPKREEKAVVHLSILKRYMENSVYIMGKLESSTIKYGDIYTLMNSKVKIIVYWLFNSEKKEFHMLYLEKI